MNSDSLAPKLIRVAALAAALVLAGTGMPDAGARTSAPARAVGENIRVGTFNIRTVAGDTKPMVGAQQPWKVRRAVVVKEIMAEHPDVFGVQEASQNPNLTRYLADPASINQYGDLRSGLLAAGGTYALVNDVISNCVDPTSEYHCVRQYHGASHDTRIFYNTTTLRVVKSGSYQFTRQSGGQNDTRYLAWAVFSSITTGKQFFFANTHLVVGHPDIQLAQWKELITRVKELSVGLPRVVVGDFQSSRWNGPALKMVPTMKRAGFGDVLGQQVKVAELYHPRAVKRVHVLLDSFNAFQRDLVKSGHIAARPHIGANVDWIFASNNLPVPEYKVVLNYDPRAKFIRGTIPSDHNLMRATITLP